MSDTEVSHVNCAAHGCPCLGVATRSTNGSKEWYCMIHFGSESKGWQAITAELNRLVWLVDATRTIRLHAGKKSMQQHSGAIYSAINLAQRGDLQQKDHESDAAWGIRLEDVLSYSCGKAVVQSDAAGEAA